MKKKTTNNHFVDLFRQASPYIHAHRGSTCVIAFGGEAISDDSFSHLVHDISLLQSLGLKLVLVHGCRPQVEERLKLRKAKMQIVNDQRITDNIALACVKEAAGAVRIEMEALFSMGLPNSPMSGAKIKVSSGNFVTAKPLGIIDGIDYQHTGEVRKIDKEGLLNQLDLNSIVLVSPLGYSPTGEVFNLNAADIASEIAKSISADKLIFLTEKILLDGKRKLIGNIVPKEIDVLMARRKNMTEQETHVLCNAAAASRGGVKRTHILCRHIDGILLSELFTRDGAGTLVTQEPYEITRKATIEDVGGILELIQPLEEKGILVRRSREALETEINHFTIIERDKTIIACAAVYDFPKQQMAELACVAVHAEYQGIGRGDALLNSVEKSVLKKDIKKLFVLTTQTSHWFREHGFKTANLDVLPSRKRDLYNWQRNAKVFVKTVS